MIPLQYALYIHSIVIDDFGGADGIRELSLLESSLARPYATFDGEELYPQVIDKAAALIESILMNHPFIDGNKRTGYFLMSFILLENGLDIKASESDKYEFVISITTGERRFEDIKKWLSDNTQAVDSI